MAFVPTSTQSHGGSDAALAEYREEIGAVDTTLRPVLASLIGWSILWLLIGGVLALIASWKTHSPDFLAEWSFLTFGRVYPAGTNALLYGWGFNAAFAIGIWLLARLAGAAPSYNRLVVVAVWFWNFAIWGGVGGILAGDSSGIEWFELPSYVLPALIVTFFLIGSWSVTTLRVRVFREIFISQWYVIAGLFWFAWIFSVSAMMLDFYPVRGTVQAVIGTWYAEGLFSLWFGSIALAALYYFIPKISGRAIRYYSLALLGFWSYGVFYGWLGVQRLTGAPVPAWVQSAGVATTALSMVALAIISISLLTTLVRAFRATEGSVALKFFAFGAIAFTIRGLQLGWNVLSNPSLELQLTYAAKSEVWLSILGFFGMTAFGALYFIVPRIARRGWSSSMLINVHWIASALGIILIYVALLAAGLKQGAELADPGIDFLQIVRDTAGLLLLRTAGFAVLFVGQLAFALNFVLTVGRLPSSKEEPLVLPEPPAMEVAT